MKSKLIVVLILGLLIIEVSCRKPEPIDIEQYDERLSGGTNTVFDETSSAFSNIFPSLSGSKSIAHNLGDASFERVFVSAPAPVNPGLGPIYNNVSCISCHAADGRGKAPLEGEGLLSLLLRISIKGTGIHGEPKAVPNFGGQLQSHAIFNIKPEADVITQYTYSEVSLNDNTIVELRKPNFIISNTYSSMPNDILVSPRLAPPVFGLGLLEAISVNEILSHADEFDSNNDGISGKPNYVWNTVTNKVELGRFGWKAGQPNLKQQSAPERNTPRFKAGIQ